MQVYVLERIDLLRVLVLALASSLLSAHRQIFRLVHLKRLFLESFSLLVIIRLRLLYEIITFLITTKALLLLRRTLALVSGQHESPCSSAIRLLFGVVHSHFLLVLRLLVRVTHHLLVQDL